MIDIRKFKRLNALVIGDLMIDEYLWGSVDRISPEAPVPVVAVERENQTLGGAGNVINNLVSLGAEVFAIGTAGTGKAGQAVFKKLKDLGVETAGIISEPDRPTTRKTRVIASNQQVLRIDREIKRRIHTDTLGKLVTIIASRIQEFDFIIISDYDKGLVTRELVAAVTELAKKNKVLTLADPKSLDFSKYKGVNVLTPNKKEAGLAAGIDLNTSEDIQAAAQKIMAQADLEKLIITCGKDGMVLFEKGNVPITIASKARQVFDVSGAGDTVISVLGLGLAAGFGFEVAAHTANTAAGIVVAKVGTAAVSIHELNQAVEKKS
ncbi:MAG: D-glycero-beta-D-manno-heptose-7-phosphate kinase [Desulfobacterales bacterium]|nr:MAG: D-glycero-beta-D-manno-heptose-7-phosphate kinase [Desulfobacterales bacterium]